MYKATVTYTRTESSSLYDDGHVVTVNDSPPFTFETREDAKRWIDFVSKRIKGFNLTITSKIEEVKIITSEQLTQYFKDYDR